MKVPASCTYTWAQCSIIWCKVKSKEPYNVFECEFVIGGVAFLHYACNFSRSLTFTRFSSLPLALLLRCFLYFVFRFIQPRHILFQSLWTNTRYVAVFRLLNWKNGNVNEKQQEDNNKCFISCSCALYLSLSPLRAVCWFFYTPFRFHALTISF